jgi:Ca2+-binding EF-hand superfamily protein
VTQDEVVAAAQKRFARMDANGDGKLTADELTSRHGRRAAADGAPNERRAAFAQKHFDKLDANHDGVVTRDEFVAAATARFQKLDSHGSGKITAADIASSPKAQERAQHAVAHIVQRLDANGDGVVSQDEYLAAAKKRFSRMDRNGDGFIDADEMPAHRWAHGGKAVRVEG